jgi:hypothetical protein
VNYNPISITSDFLYFKVTMLRGLCLPVNTLGVTPGTGWGGILGGDVGCTTGGRVLG